MAPSPQLQEDRQVLVVRHSQEVRRQPVEPSVLAARLQRVVCRQPVAHLQLAVCPLPEAHWRPVVFPQLEVRRQPVATLQLAATLRQAATLQLAGKRLRVVRQTRVEHRAPVGLQIPVGTPQRVGRAP